MAGGHAYDPVRGEPIFDPFPVSIPGVRASRPGRTSLTSSVPGNRRFGMNPVFDPFADATPP